MVVVCEVSRVRFLSIFYSGAAFWRRKNTRERCLFFCFFGCCSLPGFFKQKKRLAGTSTLLYCGSQIYVNLLLNAAVSVASQQHS